MGKATAFVILMAVAVAGCPHRKAPDKLSVAPGSYDFSKNPTLLERILGSPHGYFRFVNVAFANAVCERFDKSIPGMPTVNLHGDAHLEQYAVTELGRGLTDFDDSATGPGILDIVRFGVSAHLTCREVGWGGHEDAVVEAFLRGYMDALDDPDAEAPEPGLVKRVRSGFRYDAKNYLEWIASLMEPVDDAEREAFTAAFRSYAEASLAEDKSLPPGFFRIVQMGRLHIGIGSALDVKYLLRVAGPTDAPGDDVVLEAKEVRDLSGISCIQGSHRLDPFRILVGQSRIAYRPYKFLGYMRFRDRNFWVHAWAHNYKELVISGAIGSTEEILEVVHDVGVQLGRGHPRQIATPLDAQLRKAQLETVRRHEADIKLACKELAGQIVTAWERFRAEVKSE